MEDRTRVTTLVEVRRFLAERGCAPAPWEAAPRVVARLHAALRERQADGLFWADLKALVERLEDRRFDRAALRGSLALSEATVAQMLDELRGALDGGGNATDGDGGDGRRGWLKPFSGAALLMFLLLGSAVGCNESSSGSDDPEPCPHAEGLHLTSEESEVYCELVSIIHSSDLQPADRSTLYECLPYLDAARRASLLDQFQNMSEADLAHALNDLVDYCWNFTDGGNGQDYDSGH